MLTQLGQTLAHHLQFDAMIVAVGEVDDVAGDQLDGLGHAHGVDCWPPRADLVEITFVPSASVKRTSRDTGAQASVTCTFTFKCPVARV